MFERILVATDGSKHSERAAASAIEVARLYGSTITALYVLDHDREYAPLGDLTSGISEDLIAGIRRNLQEQGEKALAKVAQMVEAAGMVASRRISEGHPAEEIIRISEEIDAGLIVMGGMGATGIDRYLLGSVADRVVRGSRIPVLVVKGI